MTAEESGSKTSTDSQAQRRTVLRGAAWATPVVAVVVAAPAFAASRVSCPVLPTSAAGWTTTTSGTLGPAASGGFGWNPAGANFSVYRDNGSITANLVVTSTTTVAVTPGATYTVTFPYTWGYGNGNALVSTQGTFAVLFNGVVQKSLTTRTAAVDSAPASPITSEPGTTTQTFSYTVPAGQTSLTITYRQTLTPSILTANDDINVGRPVFGNCVA